MKLGDKVYRNVPVYGLWEYTVVGVMTDDQYIVRCEACTHGWKCELRIGPSDHADQFVYLHMENNRDDDSQLPFHEFRDYNFHRTRRRAAVDAARKNLTRLADEVRSKEAGLEQSRKRYAEQKSIIETLLAEIEQVTLAALDGGGM